MEIMFSVYEVCQSPVTCSAAQDTVLRKPGLLPMKCWCKDLFLIRNKLNAISFPAHIFPASVYVHDDLKHMTMYMDSPLDIKASG